MTARDLVAAVVEVSNQTRAPIVSGDEIYDWCAANNVDWGESMTPKGKHFWKADHANAPSMLRKFKREPVTHVGKNAWCHASRWSEACGWSATHAPRWQAVPWDHAKRNWMWRKAERVDETTPPFDVFDLLALSRREK